MASELAVIDSELCERGCPLLDATFETACGARADSMRGEDDVTHGSHCGGRVHDHTRMTSDEIEALSTSAAGAPCVRSRRRSEGCAAGCPLARSSAIARAARALAAVVLFGASAGAAAIALVPFAGRAPGRAPTASASEVAPSAAVGVQAPSIDVGALRSTPEPEDRSGPFPAPITRDDLDRHIRWIAPQAWEIDRALVGRAIEAASGARWNRLIPHERDGRVVGVKVYGIRRDSLLGRLGIQNGDMIVDVNGYRAGSPDEALEAYARLRETDAFFVRVERRSVERVHVYRITD